MNANSTSQSADADSSPIKGALGGTPTIAVLRTAADCGLRPVTCVIHRIRGGLPTREPLRLRSVGPRRPAVCGLRPAFIHRIQAGRPLGVPYDAVRWTAAVCCLRTAACVYSQDSGGTPFGRPLRCGPLDRGGLRLFPLFAAGSPRGAPTKVTKAVTRLW